MATVINLKRFFRMRSYVDRIIVDYFGFSWRENQYFYRLQHFTDEKKLLGRVLVEEVLPKIITQIQRTNGELNELNIILDSGTTITPIFPNLLRRGVPVRDSNILVEASGEGLRLAGTDVSVNIFTNNLAGIDEIHKLDPANGDALTKRNFNLLGGRPLSKYRATTGVLTQQILKGIWKRQRKSNNRIVSIGIITANWLLAGAACQRLEICAKGEGHAAYKISLINNCQYLVVVAPLGKILRIEDVQPLNQIIEAGNPDLDVKYQAFPLLSNERTQGYLLTSFRPEGSLSPLLPLSRMLELSGPRGDGAAFTLCGECPTFDPRNTRAEALIVDVPHEYVRRNFETLYGFPLPKD